MLDNVAAEGVVAGKPLKDMLGPVVIDVLEEVTERVINPDPFEPRFATP